VRENRFTPRDAISNGQREAVAQHTEDLTWLNENTLTFNKTFGERHHFSALLGHSQQEASGTASGPPAATPPPTTSRRST
jgi:hypothetical protein